MKSILNYETAGVSTKNGDDFVDWIQNQTEIPNPHADKIVDGVGGFASLFRFQFPEMKSPCVVSCTDGVGTKVKLAAQFQDYSGIGQDLVAMCVNDLICTGGRPLFFLDYYATGKLELGAAKEFLTSVRQACVMADCALVGGETAEMPGVYHGNDFDCAGFAIGVVDEEKRWGPHKVKNGDRIFGLASSGFHSNGYSLLRKVFENDLPHWKEILLTPTRLYVDMALAVSRVIDVHAAAHITGGGIDNIPRSLPPGARWERQDWEWPEIFREVQTRTGLDNEAMLTSLNCGIGFCFVIDPKDEKKLRETIQKFKVEVFDLGPVII